MNLPPSDAFPLQYRKSVWLFNRRLFFECHEILEPLWMETVGTEKIFYQMLIHAAVQFVHWENGNRHGVLSLHRTFAQKAVSIGAAYKGLDLGALQAEMGALVEPLRADSQVPLAPMSEIVTPTLRVSGFSPEPCDDDELRLLARESDDD